MQNKKSIHWFRQDLRIKDNPSLDNASQFDSLLPIYILDDTNSEEFSMGATSRWWLYHSLRTLNESLDGKLIHTCITISNLRFKYSNRSI